MEIVSIVDQQFNTMDHGFNALNSRLEASDNLANDRFNSVNNRFQVSGTCFIRNISEGGPPQSALIYSFSKFTRNVDQSGSGWTTITSPGGPRGLKSRLFTFC